MLDSLGLLRAMNGIREEDVVMAGNIYFDNKKTKHFRTKRIITFALAAALIIALGTIAYAAVFSMARRVPDSSETFRIKWEGNPRGYLDWSDAKLAVTFPETAESREIEFRPGWLPDEMAALKSEAWSSWLTAERLPFQSSPDYAPAYQNMIQPLLINTYYMSEFNDGGALLLLYHEPGEITEEHWDELGVDVMRFCGRQHFDAVPERDIPERTLEQNIILLSNPEAGWVLRVCGEISMDELIKIAKNIEVRETGNILTYDDFESHFAFMDGGVG